MFGKKPQKVNKNGLHLDLLVMLKQHMHGSLYARKIKTIWREAQKVNDDDDDG